MPAWSALPPKADVSDDKRHTSTDIPTLSRFSCLVVKMCENGPGSLSSIIQSLRVDQDADISIRQSRHAYLTPRHAESRHPTQQPDEAARLSCKERSRWLACDKELCTSCCQIEQAGQPLGGEVMQETVCGYDI